MGRGRIIYLYISISFYTYLYLAVATSYTDQAEIKTITDYIWSKPTKQWEPVYMRGDPHTVDHHKLKEWGDRILDAQNADTTRPPKPTQTQKQSPRTATWPLPAPTRPASPTTTNLHNDDNSNNSRSSGGSNNNSNKKEQP